MINASEKIQRLRDSGLIAEKELTPEESARFESLSEAEIHNLIPLCTKENSPQSTGSLRTRDFRLGRETGLYE